MSVLKAEKLVPLSGSEAIALAVKQANVDVIAAYPITPQTIIVERLSEYVNDGELDAEYVAVESEHSAMSACVAASLAGARVFTSTASQGLALMHEVLYLASSMRCPIVMAVANRALSAPINIHCDHSDVMGSRDSGWIQVFAENAQQAYDRTLQAFKLAENGDVLLPVMVNIDGFFVSHSVEGVATLPDGEVSLFLPPRKAKHRIDPSSPLTFGPLALPDWYFEIKYQHAEVMERVPEKLAKVEDEYYKLSGRRYGHLDGYMTHDAEIIIVIAGSAAGTARVAVSKMRQRGIKVGVLSVRLFRPFPSQMLVSMVKHAKALVVMDRAMSIGAPSAPIGQEVKASLYDAGISIPVVNVVYGLGGRDIPVTDFERLVEEVNESLRSNKPLEKKVKYWGVRI